MGYTLKQNVNIALESMGIDPLFIIKETFLGYKYRKQEHILYNHEPDIPTKLITLYYGLLYNRTFPSLQKFLLVNCSSYRPFGCINCRQFLLCAFVS